MYPIPLLSLVSCFIPSLSFLNSHDFLFTCILCLSLNTALLEASVKPKNCICPGESYGCEVTFATKIDWKTSIYENDGLFAEYTLLDADDKEIQETDDFYVTFMGSIATDDLDNYTSTLLVTNVFVNGTILTCRGSAHDRREDRTEVRNDSTKICLVGKSIPVRRRIICYT